MAQITVGDPTCGSDSTSSSTTTTSTSLNDWRNLHSAQQGWECPRCGRINAPWVRQCYCSSSNWTITWTSDHVNFDPDWYKKVTCADNVLNNPNTYSTTVGGSDYWDNMSQVWTNNPHVSNKIDPNTVTTAWNNRPSTQTIHNGKTNYKE